MDIDYLAISTNILDMNFNNVFIRCDAETLLNYVQRSIKFGYKLHIMNNIELPCLFPNRDYYVLETDDLREDIIFYVQFKEV